MILDSIFVVLIGMSASLGYKRGFTDEVIRLITFVVSAAGAYGFFRTAPRFLHSYIQQDLLVQVSSGLMSIVGLLIFFKLIRHFLKSLIKNSPLAMFDKVLGLGVGMIRGLLLIVLVYWLSGIFLTDQFQAQLPIWKNLSDKVLEVLPCDWRASIMNQFLGHHADFNNAKKSKSDEAFRSLVDLKPKPQEAQD
jgi:membrane protein required for colicin V production